MKIIIIVSNIISVLALAGWAYFIWLNGMAAGFNTTGSTGTPKIVTITASFFIVLLIVTIASIIASHLHPSKLAILWAVIPLVVSLGYLSFLGIQKARFHALTNEYRIEMKSKLDSISKDYLFNGQPLETYQGSTSKFFTYDKANQEIVEIDVYDGEMIADVYAFGKIKGDTLEVVLEEVAKDANGYYKKFLDKNGKSIFDNYKVVFVPDQMDEDYHLSQYH